MTTTPAEEELHTLPVVVQRTAQGGVQIGEVTYQRPFSQYGMQVEQAIRGLLEASTLTSTIKTKEQHWQDQSFWLVELGLAHRSFVAFPATPVNTATSTTSSNENSVVNPHLEKSLNALHQAHKVYDRLRQHHHHQRRRSLTSNDESLASNDDALDAATTTAEEEQQWLLLLQETQVALANVHFHLGESYILHPQLDQRALGHYRESERLFRDLIEQNRGETTSTTTTMTTKLTNSQRRSKSVFLSYDTADLHYHWAESCLQLGIFLLNQHQTNLEEELLQQNGVDATAAIGVSSSMTSIALSSKSEGKATTMTTTTRRTTRTNVGGTTMAQQQQLQQHQQQLMQLNEMIKNAKEANSLLEKAITVYRTQLEGLPALNDSRTQNARSSQYRDDDLEQEEETIYVYKMKLATALHHSATALTFLSTSSLSSTPATSSSSTLLRQGLERQDEALELYRQVLSHVEKKKANDYSGSDPENALVATDLIFSIANSLYSLSDLHLQLGQYDQAQSRYEETMNWYLQYEQELPPPTALDRDQQALFLEGDGTLEAYELALEQYHEQMQNEASDRRLESESNHRRTSVGGGRDDDELMDPDGDGSSWILDSNGDETYEGDLHATLGTLRMARGDVELAMGHYDQAVRLYRSSAFLSGDEEDRSVADVHFNWATALFRAGQYKQSAVLHGQALEGYRKVVGEGKNPLTEGLLGDDGEDYLEGLGMVHEDGSALASSDVGVDTNGSNDGASEQPAVPLIDLSMFQHSMLNATTGDEL
jgi:tetratricopeptide (TPR) repeat protein